MEMLILLVWALAVFFAPFLLLVTAFHEYFQQEKVSRIIIRLGAALIGYGLTTAATIPFFFVIIFAGAHSEIGATLDLKGMFIYTAMTTFYIGICYLLVSLVKGSLFNPLKIFAWENDENISIFE